MAKHKFAFISSTVQDRVISSKFSTHRVSQKCTLSNFKKNFPLPQNGGHFEFSNFLPKMAKHKIASISLTVRDRAISSKFSTHRVSKEMYSAIFKKFSPPLGGVGVNIEVCVFQWPKKCYRNIRGSLCL